ncbi:helicase-associated domain-containing protein [Dactylosporangium darangshiense]|uniref:Helicase XPB/Ssl2 N-terminal domain-containing protein n=1 Tax=Dactylosporangium darangshiense TaxID=579108 RepID=A0ABP8DUK6_9ACTN
METPQILQVASLLTLPQLQVVEVLSLRAAGTRRRDLARALGVVADDPLLAAALGAVLDSGLARIDEDDSDWIRTVALHEVIANGYGFGRAAEHELRYLPLEQLQRIAFELGAPVGRDHGRLVKAIGAALADPDVVREQFRAAPRVAQDIMLDLASGEPFYSDPHAMMALRNGRRASPLRWAVDHGLLIFNAYYGAAISMPSEVGAALRPDFRAGFDPSPPAPQSVPVSAEMVDREGSAAARSALASVTALLEECGRTPVPILKAGGIGLREVRKLARALATDEEGVRFWLTVAGMNGLIGIAGDRVAPSAEFDNWLKLEPNDQFGWLVEGWFQMPAAPLLLDGRPALVGSEHDGTSALLRVTMAAVLASLRTGRGAAGIEGLATMLAYLRPLVAGDAEEAVPMVEALWREYELMGVGAHHAPTALCHALAEGDQDRLAAALRDFLPAAQETVLLQSDLTAVATGTPSAALSALLDLAADRESRGGGYTWRFTEPSVRRAFDAGCTAEELIARIRAAAAGGRVPQPLEYLVADLGRKHGNVRVRTVGCVLRSDDVALLGEIRSVRSLARLELTELAPTVLSSALSPSETLAALRHAGYVPAAENPDGTIAFERPTRHRADMPSAGVDPGS